MDNTCHGSLENCGKHVCILLCLQKPLRLIVVLLQPDAGDVQQGRWDWSGFFVHPGCHSVDLGNLLTRNNVSLSVLFTRYMHWFYQEIVFHATQDKASN